MTMELRSPDIEPDSIIEPRHVYNGGGCSGDNQSPALEWSGAPAGTRSLAITCYDPDAPSGSGWWHWLVYDIPPGATSLPAGAGTLDGRRLPPGAKQGRNDYSEKSYGGPCPPPGDKPHRYIFTVFALGVTHLEVPEDASGAAIGFEIHFSKLDSASFTAKYGR